MSKFKIGDRVKLINIKDPEGVDYYPCTSNKLSNVGFIKQTLKDEKKIHYLVHWDNGSSNWYGSNNLEIVKEEQIISKFKVGDRVKLVNNSGLYNYSEEKARANTVGNVGTVKQVHENEVIIPYLVRWDNGSRSWYAHDNLEIIKEEQVMSKIKVGDKVKLVNLKPPHGVTSYSVEERKKIGSIGVVESVSTDEDFFTPLKIRWDNGGDSWYHYNNVELIETMNKFKPGQTVYVPHLKATGIIVYEEQGHDKHLYLVAIAGMRAHILFESDLVEVNNGHTN